MAISLANKYLSSSSLETKPVKIILSRLPIKGGLGPTTMNIASFKLGAKLLNKVYSISIRTISKASMENNQWFH